MKKASFLLLLCFPFLVAFSQPRWQNVDSAYGPLPPSMHIFFTDQAIDTAPFRAFYLVANLKDRKLDFTTDTALDRRFTPSVFYERARKPLAVVNGTFFSFETNRNLNVVIRDGKVVAYNLQAIPGKGKDTLTYRHPFASAIGIDKKRNADVAWTFTDSATRSVWASESKIAALRDSIKHHSLDDLRNQTLPPSHQSASPSFKKWKVETAIGGGPVLLQQGEVAITNNEELKFGGKEISDKHPRTAMGYTADGRLIILVVEGRNPRAHGATLRQEAELLKDLGCVEALNLDGGGSSCLLVNGKETIRPAGEGKQRPVPAVFLIRNR